ncbi:MAG: hypothetical protein H3C30_04120 [Candidatus Hydrogenedentes bacterium]|nr:hypothetical protein [Candidatus Hydrogenedentota bacterium]
MDLSELFTGTPPEPVPGGMDSETLAHWGFSHGLEPTETGAAYLANAEQHGMVCRAVCPDGAARTVPLSRAQQAAVRGIFGMLRGGEQGREILFQYAGTYRRFLGDTEPHPWDFGAEHIEAAAGVWWRTVRDVPSVAGEFTRETRARLETLAARAAVLWESRVDMARRHVVLADKNPALRLSLLVGTGKLSPTFDAPELVRFAIVNGWRLTPAGVDVARRAGLLDLPDVAAPVASNAPPKNPKGAGRKPPSKKDARRDKAIYEARKAGKDYEGIAERFGISIGDVKNAYDRHRKRISRKHG